jgi:hypothetical protein
VRTHTKLTPPPRKEPDPSGVVRTADRERYVAGPAIPTEPRVPSHHQRTRIRVAVVLVVALLGWLAYLRVTAGQFQDPALTDLGPGLDQGPDQGTEAPADPAGTPTDVPTVDALA